MAVNYLPEMISVFGVIITIGGAYVAIQKKMVQLEDKIVGQNLCEDRRVAINNVIRKCFDEAKQEAQNTKDELSKQIAANREDNLHEHEAINTKLAVMMVRQEEMIKKIDKMSGNSH